VVDDMEVRCGMDVEREDMTRNRLDDGRGGRRLSLVVDDLRLQRLARQSSNDIRDAHHSPRAANKYRYFVTGA